MARGSVSFLFLTRASIQWILKEAALPPVPCDQQAFPLMEETTDCSCPQTSVDPRALKRRWPL